jgi:hypothetical protein
LVVTISLFVDSPANTDRKFQQPILVFNRLEFISYERMENMFGKLGFPYGESVFTFSTE